MRGLGVVGITLLGLWTAIGAVSALFASLSFSTGESDLGVQYELGLYVAPAIILFTIGLALVIGRNRLAQRWFSDESVEVATDATSLLRLGIILVGLVVSLSALETVLFSVLRPVIVAANDRALLGSISEPFSAASVLPGALVGGLQLVAGLLLALFSRLLATWLWTHERAQAVSDVELARCPQCGNAYDPADYELGAQGRCTKCGEPLDTDGA